MKYHESSFKTGCYARDSFIVRKKNTYEEENCIYQ